MTGSSRTDAGVHAEQNYFHFDYDGVIHPQFLYKFNAILPSDIVAKQLTPVGSEAHSRFDALAREVQVFYLPQQGSVPAGQGLLFSL